MLKFLDLKKETFALDISDLVLRMAVLEKRGKFLKLVSWGEKYLDPGIVVEGEIKDENLLAKAVTELIKKAKGKKIKSKNVLISLPERKAFIRIISMPKMKPEELKTAVLFESENYIPFPINEVYFDFQVIPSSRGYLKDSINVLIAAIPKKIVDGYVSALEKADLKPQVFEVESQSISRALIKNGISPCPTMIIDFGRSRTSFIIYSGHSLCFTSSIPISSQKITESIAKNLKVSQEKAEKLKIKYGLFFPTGKKSANSSNKGGEGALVFESAIPIITDLVEQAKRYIEYFQTHSAEMAFGKKGPKIEKILLSGRAANAKNLASYISNELQLPVEFGNPWINILPSPIKEVPELPFKESMGYTTALGLAIRAARGEEIQ